MSWRRFFPGTALLVAACLLWVTPMLLIPTHRVIVTSAPVIRSTELMQFKVDVSGDYVVQTILPRVATPFTMLNEVMVARPGDPMFISLTWAVYSQGRVVASGSSHQGTSPFSTDELAGQNIGTFHAEAGTPYILQVRNGLISSTLMAAIPSVRVVMSPLAVERLSQERWYCQVLALCCGLVGAVWLVVGAMIVVKRGGRG